MAQKSEDRSGESSSIVCLQTFDFLWPLCLCVCVHICLCVHDSLWHCATCGLQKKARGSVCCVCTHRLKLIAESQRVRRRWQRINGSKAITLLYSPVHCTCTHNTDSWGQPSLCLCVCVCVCVSSGSEKSIEVFSRDLSKSAITLVLL